MQLGDQSSAHSAFLTPVISLTELRTRHLRGTDPNRQYWVENRRPDTLKWRERVEPGDPDRDPSVPREFLGHSPELDINTFPSPELGIPPSPIRSPDPETPPITPRGSRSPTPAVIQAAPDGGSSHSQEPVSPSVSVLGCEKASTPEQAPGPTAPGTDTNPGVDCHTNPGANCGTNPGNGCYPNPGTDTNSGADYHTNTGVNCHTNPRAAIQSPGLTAMQTLGPTLGPTAMLTALQTPQLASLPVLGYTPEPGHLSSPAHAPGSGTNFRIIHTPMNKQPASLPIKSSTRVFSDIPESNGNVGSGVFWNPPCQISDGNVPMRDALPAAFSSPVIAFPVFQESESKLPLYSIDFLIKYSTQSHLPLFEQTSELH